MQNLDRVIKGLECCILNDIDGHDRCSQCPYDATCVSGLMTDTLEILKAGADARQARCKDEPIRPVGGRDEAEAE